MKKILGVFALLAVAWNAWGAVTPNYVNLMFELGGGAFAYVGGGYHFHPPAWLPVGEAGILCGYTYLNDDVVHVIEPDVYLAGPLGGPFTWRVKAGKVLVTSNVYQASGEVWTGSLDAFWHFMPWAYVELSVPYIRGEQGWDWAPCLGLGFSYSLGKGGKP